MTAGLVGLSFAPAKGEAYYIPVGHVGLEAIGQLPLEEVIAKLKPLLEDRKLAKIAHNGKYDMTVLAQHGVAVQNLSFDSMLAAYLLGEKSMGLKNLAFARLAGESGILGLPVVVGGVAHSILAAEVGHLGSSLTLLQHGDDLFLGVLPGFHESSSVFLLYRKTLSHDVAVFGGKVTFALAF